MPELPARLSALARVALQGRFGAGHSAPGITLAVRHPLTIALVMAQAGQGEALAKALKSRRGASVLSAGPDQYFVQGADAAQLASDLSGLAAVTDQSHGRVVIRVSGPRVRALLAKGTPVDLHESVFAIGQSAMTQMAHVGVHITRVGADSFDLSLFRGFAESFWEWLTSQSAEYGYQVS